MSSYAGMCEYGSGPSIARSGKGDSSEASHFSDRCPHVLPSDLPAASGAGRSLPADPKTILPVLSSSSSGKVGSKYIQSLAPNRTPH